MFQLIRYLRHNQLKFLSPFWLILGKLYRLIIKTIGIKYSVEHNIGEYGPFKLDGYFSFSNFDDWGIKHGPNPQFKNCIESCRGKKCVIDIGAHIGLVSLPISTVIEKNGRVYSFEPSNANLKFLKNHIRNNGVSNIEVCEYIVGEQDSLNVSFYEDKNASGMNSIINLKDIKDLKKNSHKQICLNTFCKSNNITPDVIKIDVEGAELRVLKGAINILKKYKPILFLSVHPSRMNIIGDSVEELMDILEQLNYVPEKLEYDEISKENLGEYKFIPG